MSHKLQTALRTFCRDIKGVAATEFAMILPFMLVLLIGMSELADMFNQDRKVNRMTNAVTDLVAQAETVTTTELDGVFEITEEILAPYPVADLNMIIASVTFDPAGDATVDWSYDNKGNSPAPSWPADSPPPVTIPGTVVKANTSIVLGQSSLVFTSRFRGFLAEYFSRDTVMTLSDTYYLRPRLTDQVRCQDC